MSNSDGEHETPLARQPRAIGQMAQVEIEKPSRKMTLMFGERQVVFLRSDGLRSRVFRENLKKSEKELEEEKKKHEMEERKSETLDEVIDYVARGGISAPTSLTSSVESTSTSSLEQQESDRSVSPTTEPSSSSTKESSISSAESSFSLDLSAELNRKRPVVIGNRSHHPPKQFHGESTMVTHKKRWTYQTACNINATDLHDDSPTHYISHPFLPMPRGRHNGISTADRMNYAAQRMDNRKFRGQVEARKQIASKTNNERISCEKCGMHYFFEKKQFDEKISYLPPINEEDLPIVIFDCPVCKVQTRGYP